jgi:hypothetical protein
MTSGNVSYPETRCERKLRIVRFGKYLSAKPAVLADVLNELSFVFVKRHSGASRAVAMSGRIGETLRLANRLSTV